MTQKFMTTLVESVLSGHQLIGFSEQPGSLITSPLRGSNPRTGESLPGDFTTAGAEQVEAACALAAAAAAPFGALEPEARATFLDAIAAELHADAEALTERAHLETGLPMARVQGELSRTAGQMTLFARVLRKGDYLRVTVDSPDHERKPLAKPALRTMQIPVGPVAVFGASNFPLAYSAAGGDTASALAAGCPVVMRAHPAHPGTGELAARAILRAARSTGMPEGVYSLLTGSGNELGQQIVRHPAIRSVGFTGSRKGGLALAALAAERTFPIPVFAEMSSVNPIFLFPGALHQRGPSIGESLVASVLQGVGQFCTSPGLVFGVGGEHWQAFKSSALKAMQASAAGTMLHSGIAEAYRANAGSLASLPGVTLLASGASPKGDAVHWQAQPQLCSTDAASFLKEPRMMEEVFGPASLLIECTSVAQMMEAAGTLEGQLTATVHLEQEDHTAAAELIGSLAQTAGRIIANGFPTGLEVGFATVHGGPFPATTDSRWTAVGARAIERWLRPVCFQDFPESLLPAPLQTSNPLNVPRLQDGTYRS
jgi:alpha-ketoglutaric semialdehyde dehydrogenase